jgi:hypothetical protein
MLHAPPKRLPVIFFTIRFVVSYVRSSDAVDGLCFVCVHFWRSVRQPSTDLPLSCHVRVCVLCGVRSEAFAQHFFRNSSLNGFWHLEVLGGGRRIRATLESVNRLRVR